MPTIIDGYNLLHVVGLLGDAIGPGGLERSRLALLNFLAESLDADEVPHTTVVFDARNAPWGAPRTMQHRGLTVHFASGYDDADSLIEELIRHESAARQLTVVSSDHRLQRAAHRRKAAGIDSDVWYGEVVRLRRQRQQTAADQPERPPVPLLAENVDYWIKQFGGEALLKQLVDEALPTAQDADVPAAPSEQDARDPEDSGDKDVCGIENPFPPGYADDLLAKEKHDRIVEPFNPFPPGYGEDLEER
jgi:predicted RNA-binding protein with PIN domain